jgi:uncharacterized protein (DUF433 family)
VRTAAKLGMGPVPGTIYMHFRGEAAGICEKQGNHCSNRLFKSPNAYRYNDRNRRPSSGRSLWRPDPMTFTRITVNPMQMGGVPCIRGLRIPVATVIEMIADGMTPKEILGAYPDLEAGDIDEALHFAADAVRERQLPLVSAA